VAVVKPGLGVTRKKIIVPVSTLTREEMHWKCRENEECECGRLKTRAEGQCEEDKQTRRHYKYWNRQLDRERIPTTVADWRDIVETYSGLKLTYPSDRLPALLGPAMDMQPRREGTYLVGMWTDEDLTWHVPSLLLDNGYPRLNPLHCTPLVMGLGQHGRAMADSSCGRPGQYLLQPRRRPCFGHL
jgi:hypothetical protein